VELHDSFIKSMGLMDGMVTVTFVTDLVRTFQENDPKL